MEVPLIPIITLDGASAVGKTTTCRHLAAQFNAYHVPEVNHMFQRNLKNEPQEWYFERNRDRWLLAVEQSHAHDLVLIDVDVFQPLYYNWAFRYKGFQSLEFMNSFYRRYISDGTLCFPDRYVFLYTNPQELRHRKERDATRPRGGFEKNLQLVIGTKPQVRYFEALNQFFPGYVHFIDAVSVEQNVQEILDLCSSPIAFDARSRSLDILDTMIDWLSHNEP